MAHFHNNALIGSSGQGGAGDFQIDRSLRFDKNKNSYLHRTPSSAGNRRTWTWSGWVKRAGNDSDHHLFVADKDPSASLGNSTFGRFYIESGGAIRYSGYTAAYRSTTQVLRDQSAWYHIVLAVDTTQATDDDRIKIYLNGSQITDFETKNNPTQNFDLAFNQTTPHTIGARSRSGTIAHWLSGYLAEIHFVDGQQLAPSDFGEFDDNNVWQPKDCKNDLTYGTNGFYLKFADNSSVAALGTDSSGNSNTWTPVALSVGTTTPFSAEFDGTTSQYIRKAGSGILPGDTGTGTFTIECHFYPYTNSIKGLFDGGSGETNIIRNYDANAIGKQGGPTVDITGDYTVGAWNHMAAVYDGSADVLTVYINGTSSGTGSFSSYNGGNNFDIGTINTGGDGKFNGLIRNFRVTNNVVYSSNFTAPSHSNNLTNISGTQLLLFTTDSNGLLTDGSSQGHTLTNNGGVTEYNPAADNDSLIDTPTDYEADSGNNGGNYATLNPLDSSSNLTISDGNLKETTSTSGHQMANGTIAVNSGKWYVEVEVTSLGGTYTHIGISPINTSNTTFVGNNGYGYTHSGSKQGLGTTTSYGNSYAAGDCIGIAFDADNGALYFYKNGVAQNSGTAAFTGIDTSKRWRFSISHFNGGGAIVNFGQRSFKYTNAGNNRPAATYLSLCTKNLPDPTIADGATAFDVITATGTAADRTFTMSGGFGPDFVWAKQRNGDTNNALFDTVRGATKRLVSNSRNNEDTQGTQLKSFSSTGFTYGSDIPNNSGQTGVYWCWDGGTSTVTNTDGSITSTVRASTSNGFSIVKYTGTQQNATVGHGLNAPPDWIIFKDINRNDEPWFVYHSTMGSSAYQFLNTTAAKTTGQSDFMNSTDPTSSVFSLGNAIGKQNRSGSNFLALCWSAVEGFSSFGEYTGNGSADGPFVHTGFRPRWILIKGSSSGGSNYNWAFVDTERSFANVANHTLAANLTKPESYYGDGSSVGGANNKLDILSNGFKIRENATFHNDSGVTYIYAAFAEHPFKYARAR